MKRHAMTYTLAAMLLTTSATQANELFTGEVRLACEAVLCLSSGNRPKECRPAIRRYFSISARKLSDTVKKRKSFLNLCPSSTQDPKMISVVDDITNSEGRCNYASLNSTLRVWNNYEDGASYISNTLPQHCAAYNGNSYTDNAKAPRYVGIPARGGFWVNADEYEAALTEYKQRIEAENAARRAND